VPLLEQPLPSPGVWRGWSHNLVCCVVGSQSVMLCSEAVIQATVATWLCGYYRPADCRALLIEGASHGQAAPHLVRLRTEEYFSRLPQLGAEIGMGNIYQCLGPLTVCLGGQTGSAVLGNDDIRVYPWYIYD